jgi:hypothetical protein
MIEASEFKKLLDYCIKYNNNKIPFNGVSNDNSLFLISFYYLLIKNINLIESLFFFYEDFIVYAYTSLKYNILINYNYVKKFNNVFIKLTQSHNHNHPYEDCVKLLNEWCSIFEKTLLINV